MIRRFRRFAALLLALFVGHQSMVVGGLVCTSTGMAAMDAATPAQGPSMASMSDMGAPSATAAQAAHLVSSGAPAPTDHAPCSNPTPGSCIASAPCVTALGVPAAIALTAAISGPSSTIVAFNATMPASSGSAPDLPPPRA